MAIGQDEGALELWVGPECTINRVGDRWRDQAELTGFAHRPEDLDRLASLGARRVRLPILWERAAAKPGAQLDFAWSDKALASLRAAAVEPIVGLLHHGSGPRHTSLVDPCFPTLFAGYARQVAQRYPDTRWWTPINEPLTTARFSCLYGLWYPHAQDDVSFVRALLNQVHATVMAMQAIRGINPEARLLQTDDLGFTRSTPALADQAAFDNERRWLAFDLLCGRVDERHALWEWLRGCGAGESELLQLCETPCPPDVVGINAYVTSERFIDDRLDLYPPHLHGGNGRQIYADVETVRVHGELIDGFGGRLREAHARYALPLAITEVHMGCTREEQMRWLHQAWTAALQARRSGIDVRGVTAWAAFGTVDWSSLLVRDCGHYEPGLWDARSDPPRLTALGRLARALGRRERVDASAHPVLAGPGWWQRDLRLTVAPTGQATALPARGATLLILGTGALARAFARLAHMRGLPYDLQEGQEGFNTQAIEGALTSQGVWAVVEASTVDDEGCPVRRTAESDQCWASACARASVRLLRLWAAPSMQGAPMDEVGRTLHVSVGALFGPWGSNDFVARGLARLARRECWLASAEEQVRPTYLPDLVQAALDLLVDGERGLWQLDNGESISRLELARLAARHAGHDERLVKSLGAGPSTQETLPLSTDRGRGLLPSLEDALCRYQRDYEAQPRDPPPLRAAA